MKFDIIQAAGYAEIKIAVAFGISLKEVRAGLTKPNPRLCVHTGIEIQHIAEGTHASLAIQYRCTIHEIQRVMYNNRPARLVLTEDLLIEYWINPNNSIQDIATLFYTSYKRVEKWLVELKMIEDKPETKEAQIYTLLSSMPKLSKVEIARLVGCAPGTVYTVASRYGFTTSQNYLTSKEWFELHIERVGGLSIAALARKYDISRAAIYKNMEKL